MCSEVVQVAEHNLIHSTALSDVTPCCCCVLCCRLDDPGNSCCPDPSSAYELSVNEEVVIPLAAAVRAVPLVARKKDEVGETV